MRKRKSDTKYIVGDTVRSTYRGRWIGVVIASNGPIATVVPMIDSAGHPQPRRFVKRLDEHWLEYAKLEPKYIKSNWLVN